jgi:hypothetical protein
VLTVEQVVGRIDELDGETVSVTGYLAKCSGYDCVLHRTKQDADEWDRAMAALSSTSARLPVPEFPMLGIGIGGSNFDFDREAAPFTNSYVVISGTVTNECRFEGKPACTDRGADLIPTAIRRGSALATSTRA